ncbi:MAG: hydroxymethylpyrimidine/phosphomethylpyrimidine kinase [Pseudomonadota bacterium]|nr:hydroxymethylpyrimidine/phosphomethylpyrimidine kinase [Pseudomonadota bacterium]
MKNILVIGGHDPSGGAGIQADIEAIAANGCHAVTVISALTVQDTSNVFQMIPVKASVFRRQLDVLLDDMPIAAVKIGLIGNAENARVISQRLRMMPQVPVVVDPVLAAGGGSELATDALLQFYRNELLPLTTVFTPNLPEAQRLSEQVEVDDCAFVLLEKGARNVLITGGHEQADAVVNRLYDRNGNVEEWHWPILEGEFHGSGCTLASAIAAFVAQQLPLNLALRLAQAYTCDTLDQALQLGSGQLIPLRITAGGDGGAK